jgi:hypothetical protein
VGCYVGCLCSTTPFPTRFPPCLFSVATKNELKTSSAFTATPDKSRGVGAVFTVTHAAPPALPAPRSPPQN